LRDGGSGASRRGSSAAVGLCGAGPAATSGPPVFRQEGRDHRRRGCGDGSSEGAHGMSPAEEAAGLLAPFGVARGGELVSLSPIDGKEIGGVEVGDASAATAQAAKAFLEWRTVPAPRRGELVRLLADERRAEKKPLASLVTLECGKIVQEGLGEVQEMIDVCDYAVGLSRQLYGLTIASERPDH